MNEWALLKTLRLTPEQLGHMNANNVQILMEIQRCRRELYNKEINAIISSGSGKSAEVVIAQLLTEFARFEH